jgi:hypothetical protein
MTLPYFLRSLVLIGGAMLSACTLPLVGEISGTGLSNKEFEKYVEEVFRFQNRMTSEVMMLTSSDEEGNYSGLLKAEQHMQQVCAPLNEYASRDMDGLGAGLRLQQQVVKTAMDCDRAAHEVEVMLKR